MNCAISEKKVVWHWVTKWGRRSSFFMISWCYRSSANDGMCSGGLARWKRCDIQYFMAGEAARLHCLRGLCRLPGQ